VFVECHSLQDAVRLIGPHQLELNGVKYKANVYIEHDVLDVRIHDLSPSFDNIHVIDCLEQYGEVLSVRNVAWADGPLEGVANGVRVIRMKLKRPIPGILSIAGEETRVTYNQPLRQETELVLALDCGYWANLPGKLRIVKRQQWHAEPALEYQELSTPVPYVIVCEFSPLIVC
jgi:hypothetical protein